MTDSPKYFPLCFNLQDHRVVVIGGGRVGMRKVKVLLEYEANVVVISPQAGNRIRQWASQGRLTYVERAYQAADLEGATLVFAATDDAQLNAQIAHAARQRSIPINVATDPGDCDFLIPGNVRRGHFSLAISSDGYCPAFTRNLRRQLERQYDDAWGQALDLLEEARSWIQQHVASMPRRRKTLADIAQPDLVESIRRDGLPAARETLFRMLKEKDR